MTVRRRNEKFDITSPFIATECYTSPEDFKVDQEVLVKKGEELRLVTGVVLQPEVTDAQAEIYSHDEVRKAAHLFMSEYTGQGNGIMHSEIVPQLRIVESYIAPNDMTINDQAVVKGSWLMSSLT